MLTYYILTELARHNSGAFAVLAEDMHSAPDTHLRDSQPSMDTHMVNICTLRQKHKKISTSFQKEPLSPLGNTQRSKVNSEVAHTRVLT